MEMSDDVQYLLAVKAYLRSSTYPDGYSKNAKRRLREKAQSFKLINDELYHSITGAVDNSYMLFKNFM